MRRLAGLALVLLAACGNSEPAPPAASATSATTAATSVPATSAATSAPTTSGGTSTTGATSPPTSAATSGPTASGAGASDACVALIRLDHTFKDFVADYHDVKAAAEQVLQVSTTLSDQGEAVLLATIGTDAKNAAEAFLAGDLAKGARLQNRVVRTIPVAKVPLGCT